jgi:hypothetical protein
MSAGGYLAKITFSILGPQEQFSKVNFAVKLFLIIMAKH